MAYVLSAWVLSQQCGFLPQSTDTHARLIGYSKLSVVVNVTVTVCACFIYDSIVTNVDLPRMHPTLPYDT